MPGRVMRAIGIGAWTELPDEDQESPHLRVIFAVAGFLFAGVTYWVGDWIHALEYRSLSAETSDGPLSAASHILLFGHAVTLPLWLVSTSALFLFIGFLFDHQARLTACYRAQAINDSLTQVRNRRHLMSQLPVDIKRAERSSSSMSVIMVDIDHFKAYNDSKGHLAGDVALRAVANALSTSIRATDLVARFGGEEFVIVADGADKAAGRVVAERLRKSVEDCCSLTVSIGLACYPQDGTDVDDLLKAADSALYRAKDMGRNCVQVAGWVAAA